MKNCKTLIFLMRNYRAGLAKWQTADPMGYPDGWNQLAYSGNSAHGVDVYGMAQVDYTRKWTNFEFMQYYYDSYMNRIYGDMFDTDCMTLTDDIWSVVFFDILPRVEQQIDQPVRGLVRNKSLSSGNDNTQYSTYNAYDFKAACWALGGGTVSTLSQVEYSWGTDEGTGVRYYVWSARVFVNYSDIFKNPLDIGLESPFSSAYSYYHVWDNVPLASGDVLE